jgi:hypothetical protein
MKSGTTTPLKPKAGLSGPPHSLLSNAEVRIQNAEVGSCFYFCILTYDFCLAARPHITQINYLFGACFSLHAGGTKIS